MLLQRILFEKNTRQDFERLAVTCFNTQQYSDIFAIVNMLIAGNRRREDCRMCSLEDSKPLSHDAEDIYEFLHPEAILFEITNSEFIDFVNLRWCCLIDEKNF